MKLLPPDRVTLSPPTGDMPQSRLTLGAHQTTISGIRLEAAYLLEDDDPIAGYLFFSSDDVLYEDVLTITLTDPDLRILDLAWIGAPYDTALWQGVRIAGPGTIDFSLDQDGAWRVTILPRPEWRLPLPGTDGWIWRKMQFRRHFRIARNRDDG